MNTEETPYLDIPGAKFDHFAIQLEQTRKGQLPVHYAEVCPTVLQPG